MHESQVKDRLPGTKPARIALCGLGLDTYWPQFPGLRDRLCGYVNQTAEWIESEGVAVTQAGMIDDYDSACAAASLCRREQVDALFLHVTTYALSSTVLALVRRAAVPVVVLNLQPDQAIDCEAVNALEDRTAMTGEWLAWCSACSMPEIANLFARAGWPFRQVNGSLQDAATRSEVRQWIHAVRVHASLAQSRIGMMGHIYSGMLDIATDITRLAATFGLHAEMLEVDELSGIAAEVAPSEIEIRMQEILDHFATDSGCDQAEIRLAARTSAALDRFVALHRLDALAYYAKGSGSPANETTLRSIIPGASLLTARHIPVAGEYEVKNVVAMKILDLLNAGGSFSEYYAMDLRDDVVLLGHDGPGHTAIAEGKVRLRPLGVYHGKVGRGLSVEMSVRHGPVTLLSVAEDATHGFQLIVAEGASVPGPILEIGNTNSRYRFPLAAREFVQRWNAQAPAHHCAIGVGHIADTLEKLASLAQIGYKRIC